MRRNVPSVVLIGCITSLLLASCATAPVQQETPQAPVEAHEEKPEQTAEDYNPAAKEAYRSYLVDSLLRCDHLSLGHPVVTGEPWSDASDERGWETLVSYALQDLDDDGILDLVVFAEGDDAPCWAFRYDADEKAVNRAEGLDAAAASADCDLLPLTAAQLQACDSSATDDELLAFANLAKDDMRMAIAGMQLGVFVDGREGDYSYEENGTLYRRVPGVSVDDVKDLWYGCFSHRYEISDVTGEPFPYIEHDGEAYVPFGDSGDEGEDITLDGMEERTDDEAWFTGTATGRISEEVRPIRFSLVLEDGTWKYGTMEWEEPEEPEEPEDYWLYALHADGRYPVWGPTFTSVTRDGDCLHLYGTACIGETLDEVLAYDGSAETTEERAWDLQVTDETVFEGAAPEGQYRTYPKESALTNLESPTGLGIALHVVDDTITYLCFYS